jgi:hypothetical protein
MFQKSGLGRQITGREKGELVEQVARDIEEKINERL